MNEKETIPFWVMIKYIIYNNNIQEPTHNLPILSYEAPSLQHPLSLLNILVNCVELCESDRFALTRYNHFHLTHVGSVQNKSPRNLMY